MSVVSTQQFSDTARSQGDDELLAKLVIARPKSTRKRALHALGKHDLADLSRASPRELSKILDVDPQSAARVAAAFELGRRALAREAHRKKTITSAEDIYRMIVPRIAGWAQEVFFAIGIDIRNGVVDIVEVGRGSVFGVEVHPREIFRPLIRMAAAGGVLVHNHPSGDPTPSEEDVVLTRRLREAGVVLGLPIVDHVVISRCGYRSIAEYLGTELDRPTRG